MMDAYMPTQEDMNNMECLNNHPIEHSLVAKVLKKRRSFSIISLQQQKLGGFSCTAPKWTLQSSVARLTTNSIEIADTS